MTITEAQLIAKQQLEIEQLKQSNTEKNDALNQINMLCTCIGGPLNDNKLRYTSEQLGDFWKINELARCASDA